MLNRNRISVHPLALTLTLTLNSPPPHPHLTLTSPSPSPSPSYFGDDGLDADVWSPPFRSRSVPCTLRGDVLDFVATHAAEAAKTAKSGGAALTGRAIARILHRLHSPAFPKKEWERNRLWGLHREVEFKLLRQVADEQLETWRRRMQQQHSNRTKRARP